MKSFARFLSVACVGLLSWQHAAMYVRLPLGVSLLLGAGALAMILTLRRHRMGYGLNGLLGLAYLADILLTVRAPDLLFVQPMLLWSAGLSVCGFGLLWQGRDRQPAKPLYERHPDS